jgi:hypothetical protein
MVVGSLQTDEARIHELVQHQTGEWVPPISALGGPPAHALYHELVLHAGMRLYREADGEPLLVFLDGENRRTFRCPSPELMGALDRFRMRRGVRPSPAKDIDDFIRIVHARVTDPDAKVPLRPPDVPEPMGAEPPTPISSTIPSGAAGEEKESATEPAMPGDPWVPASIPGLSISFSGGFMRAGRREPPLPHYIRVLQSLVRNGGWMGTTQALSAQLGEDEAKLTETLIRYRADFAEFGIVVANVQVESGWRLLVVDRARLDDQS